MTGAPVGRISCFVPKNKLLGHELAESTVAKYMVRHRQPPSQTWRTFLDNHVPDLVGIDFFTVPTATFRVLFCLN